MSSIGDPLDLYIFSEERPTPAQIDILKRAKLASGVTEKCKPARAMSGCGRCLVFGAGRPDFVVEWANTAWDDVKLPQKVAWVLTGEGGYPHTYSEWLSAVMDVEVTEVGKD